MNRVGVISILLAVGAALPYAAAADDTRRGAAGQFNASTALPSVGNEKSGIGSSEADAKLAAETRKLQYENDKLARELRYPSWVQSPWLPVLSAFLAGLVAAGAGVYAGRRSRLGAFDQAVLAKRLQSFGRLVDATEALALYFPTAALTTTRCKEIGDRLRACYFTGVGVLLSPEARDRYFLLMRALSRAAVAERIDAPTLDDYPRSICAEKVNDYRKLLKLECKTKKLRHRVEHWVFGETAIDGQQDRVDDSSRFRDFVLLQTLSSQLRTALTKDLRGRVRPG